MRKLNLTDVPITITPSTFYRNKTFSKKITKTLTKEEEEDIRWHLKYLNQLPDKYKSNISWTKSNGAS